MSSRNVMEKTWPSCKGREARRTLTNYTRIHSVFDGIFRCTIKLSPSSSKPNYKLTMANVSLNSPRSSKSSKTRRFLLLALLCAIFLPFSANGFSDDLEDRLSALSESNQGRIRSSFLERTKSLRRIRRSTGKDTLPNAANNSLASQANSTGLTEFGSENLGYDYGMDYDEADPSLDSEYFNLPDDFVSKFYVGPVCTLIDVRNSPEDLKDLENCTIVNGFVQILFMHNTKEEDFEKYSFPKLRVITEYLLIYRVYGLRSLRKLFPNLAVIEGRKIFYNYAMVVYNNPQLQELGLGNLRHISRGGVRIQKNINLCYLETVDWNRLGRLGKDLVNRDMLSSVFKDNASPKEANCLYQCGEDYECASTAIDGYRQNCWGLKICQKRELQLVYCFFFSV